jgi:DNA-binding transcriptional LysR family regulator
VLGSLTLDEPDMMAQSSRAGVGMAYVSEWIVADDIASGGLVEVLSDWTPTSRILLLLFRAPTHGHKLARLRRSGSRDRRSESRKGVLMDTGPVARVLSGLRES